MFFDRLMFGIMYRIGFTPWEGHLIPPQLRALVEGPNALPKGKALDVGCGTGDTAIYLAKQKWDVTAIDFIEAPLHKARVKTGAAGAHVRYLRADVTKLSSSGVGSGFNLIVDSGCIHGLSDEGREAHVREITAASARDARLLIFGFGLAKRRGPKGIDRAEIERRFAADWQLLDSGVSEGTSNEPEDPIYFHDLARKPARK